MRVKRIFNIVLKRAGYKFIIMFLGLLAWYYIYERQAQTDINTIKSQNIVIDNLEYKLDYLKEANNQSPSLRWVKDSALVMLEVNEAFVTYLLEPYGLSRADVVGYDDYKNFDTVTADAYRSVGKLVLWCNCPIEQSITVPFKGDSLKWVGVKYPVHFKDGSTGVAGDFKLIRKKS